MRRARFILASIGLAFTFALSSPASAGTIEPGNSYQLLDHGFGKLGPDYGLRMDAMDWLFSVEMGNANVVLDWTDSNSPTLRGKLFEHHDSKLYTVDYTLSVISVSPEGFTAEAGSGKITDPDGVEYELIGKQNGDDLAFWLLADGHRIPNDDGTPVGTGWLMGAGTNDWLVRGTLVTPEPSTALLLGVGLVVIAGCATRLRIARGL